MVVIGSDVLKRTHTFVAVDEVGRKLAELTVPADHQGHDRAVRWAREEFGQVDRWAVEDCRHPSARLEIDLLEAGEVVVRVPPELMAEQRRLARTRGKSDPIDALAVARAALRGPDLPVAAHDEASRELRLLVERREDLVAERTRMVNRLRRHLHRIAPGDKDADPAPKSVDQADTRARLHQWPAGRDGIDARIAHDVLADIDRICPQITAPDKEITALVAVHPAGSAVTDLPGRGALTAAKIIGETAGIARFADEAKYGMHAGVTPIPVRSGRTNGEVRVARVGDRRLNAALHGIAVTRIRVHEPAKADYAQRQAAGDTHTEAIRRLERRLARTVVNTPDTNPSTAAGLLPAAA